LDKFNRRRGKIIYEQRRFCTLGSRWACNSSNCQNFSITNLEVFEAYLVLKLWYRAQQKVLFVLVALLAYAEHDNVAAGLESFAFCLGHTFVFSDALGQFGGPQHGVLLFVDDLIGGLVDAIVAVVNQVLRRITVRDVHTHGAVVMVVTPAASLVGLHPLRQYDLVLVGEEIEVEVLSWL